MVKVTVNTPGSTRVSVSGQNSQVVKQVGIESGTALIALETANAALQAAQGASSPVAAFNQANLALSTAQSAFNAANTAVTDYSPAFNQANSAYSLAQTAFTQANVAFDAANNIVANGGAGEIQYSDGAGNFISSDVFYYDGSYLRIGNYDGVHAVIIKDGAYGTQTRIGADGLDIRNFGTNQHIFAYANPNNLVYTGLYVVYDKISSILYYDHLLLGFNEDTLGGLNLYAHPNTNTYSLIFPQNSGNTNEVLTGDGTGNLRWSFVNTSVIFNLANASYNLAQTAFNQANAAPGIANSYAITIGASSNAWANAIVTAANNYAGAMANSANARANTVGTSANAYATSVGTSGNAFAVVVGSSANARANVVGTSANAYATSVGTAGNTYTLAAFNQANNANITAIAAFNKANAGSVGTSTDTQVLYNDASAVAGSSSLTFNKTTNTLGVVNVTVNGTATLNAISLAIGSTELNNRIVLANTTGMSILDSFAITAGRSAQYNITANAGSDYHTTQISLLHNDSSVFITAYGALWSNVSLASFSAALVSGVVLLNVSTNIANTTYNVFKIVNR